MTPIGLKLVLAAVVLLLGFIRCHAEGICSVEHCANNTRCLLSQHQRSCKCVTGFYGDRCDKNAHMSVVCTKSFIAIRVMEDFFKYHNVPLESLHMPNKSCRGQRAVMSGVPYYVSKISKDQYLSCGGAPLQKNFTHLTYSLTLLSDPQVSGNIIRNPIVKLDYKCIIPYVRRVSLPFPVVPFSSETVMRVDDLDATIQMLLYTDHSYTTAFSSSPIIELRDKVYVEVAVTEPAGYFLLRINECWATQLPKPEVKEGMFHPLLLNGCVNDQTVSFINVSAGQSGHNGESSTVRYSFDMFRFTAEPHDLYLHCTVQLCEPDDLKSCRPNCKSIHKRAVNDDPAQGLLSYGPIRIEMPDKPQSSILTTVMLLVAAVWTVGIFLIVIIAVAKAGSRRLAQREQQ